MALIQQALISRAYQKQVRTKQRRSLLRAADKIRIDIRNESG